jgi:hypothetical protein
MVLFIVVWLTNFSKTLQQDFDENLLSCSHVYMPMDRHGEADSTILKRFPVNAPKMIPYKLHPNNTTEPVKS